jgi:Tol biopolymer transport system component
MLVRIAGETQERDVSWLDWSAISDLSPDGKTLLFFESGEGGGPGYSTYVRKTDGSPAVRIGDGSPGTFSPDQAWVASVLHIGSDQEMTLLPTGTGEAKKLPRDGLSVDRPDWLPDSRHLLFTANEAGRGARVFTLDVAGGHPQAVTPEGFRKFTGTVSPDGKSFVALSPDRKIILYPIGGGEPRAIPGISGSEIPVRWRADGRSLYVYSRGDVPARVYEVDVASGQRQFWKELMPADPAGVIDIIAVRPTPDGRSYAYSYARVLSNLYLVEGLR